MLQTHFCHTYFFRAGVLDWLSDCWHLKKDSAHGVSISLKPAKDVYRCQIVIVNQNMN